MNHIQLVRQVMRLFTIIFERLPMVWFLLGLLFNATGLYLGFENSLVFGYIITMNVNIIERWIRVLFGLKLWSSSVYIFTRIPTEYDWYWAGFVFVGAVAASVIGALIPAIVAARTAPIKILQYE